MVSIYSLCVLHMYRFLFFYLYAEMYVYVAYIKLKFSLSIHCHTPFFGKIAKLSSIYMLAKERDNDTEKSSKHKFVCKNIYVAR